MTATPETEAWPEGLEADLERPEAFARSAPVEVVQTHLSRVFLVGDRVYKLPRPVDLGFVSFARRAERNAECVEEVRLNRRLAPDVYLGVAPLERDPASGRWRVGETIAEPRALDPTRDHCIVMRRLSPDRNALSLLRAGALRTTQLDRLAERIAGFHREASLGRPAPFSPEEWFERNAAPIRANFESLDHAGVAGVDPDALADLRARALAAIAAHRDRFERRRRAGRAVDAHGDLHLEHVWFETDDAVPIAIDGIAFNDAFRRIDAASEIAFPAMDLTYRGHDAFADRLLARYAEAADDFDLYAVVDLYAHYRAAVRAKVAALAAVDPAIDAAQRARAGESARRHLALAARGLDAAGPAPLVLVGGIVGSGKSTAARAIADASGAPIIASDRVRRILQGPACAPAERAGDRPWGGARYASDAKQAVYEAMWERARPPLEAGRPVILDATHSRRAQREAARALARAANAPCWIVEVRCPREESLRRLAARAARGADPSEAGPEQWAPSAREYEPPDDASADAVWRLDSTASDHLAVCREIGTRLRRATPRAAWSADRGLADPSEPA